MNTIPETKICQNCKQQFVIEPEDFVFYEKMKVPAPTFCPECRFQRRLMFRNERSLYKRECDLCGKDMISVFSPEKPHKVYCNPCWWSDKWDGMEFGQDYDPNRNFFEQFRELQQRVSYMNLVVDYPTLIDSEHTNHAGALKNCYLVFNTGNCENVSYTVNATGNKDSMDATMLGESELCYQDINCGKCSNVFFSEDCNDSYNIYFSKNLVGCNDCLGCINLRKKQYHIFNQPYSKEEYQKRFKDLRLDSWQAIEFLRKEIYAFWQKLPHKFIHERHNTDVSGDYIYESKNAHNMYQARFVEDGKWCQFISEKPVKDVYDYTEWGNNAQRIYDSITVGEHVDNIRFSFCVWRTSCLNVEYAFYTISSSNIFGCIGLRNKQYCVLNKQYSKENYEKLREKIISDMNERPYIDSKGRVWKYGEFFPYDLSLFAYNETYADQYFPLSKEEVLAKGWRWREPTPTQYQITLTAGQIPDSIHDIKDEFVEEIIECSSCQRAYRVIKPELDLLRRFGFPIPRKCWECRHKDRMFRINSPKLWDRQCAKCGKDIKTSYAPERPEIVYCEECYNNEVI